MSQEERRTSSGRREQPQERRQREQRPRKKQKKGFNLMGTLLYVAFVIGVSTLLAAVGWVAANDLLALNKAEHSAIITLPDDIFTNREVQVKTEEGTETETELVVDMNYVVDALKENGQTVYPTDLYKQGKWTWSVFQDYLTKIKAYFADKPAPIRPDKMINAFESDYRFSIRAAMLASGVPIYGENGFEKCTSPEAIKSVNFIKELVDKKLLVSELENSIYPGFTWADNNFANGEAVFLDSRQWTAQGCGSQLAALGLSMGLVPWPRPDDMAADDPRYQQVSTPNDSFILLKGVSEEQSRLALEAYKIYYQTYYAAKSGGSKSMDFFSDENAEKEALEKNLDIFHEKIGADILDIFKNYCPMEFNDYSMMLSQMYGFTEIAGRSIYEGGSSFEVSIAENIGALNEAIGKIEAAADAIS